LQSEANGPEQQVMKNNLSGWFSLPIPQFMAMLNNADQNTGQKPSLLGSVNKEEEAILCFMESR
jgi:hypothetical protein